MRITVAGALAGFAGRSGPEAAVVQRGHASRWPLAQVKGNSPRTRRRPGIVRSCFSSIADCVFDIGTVVVTCLQTLEVLVVEGQQVLAMKFHFREIGLRSERRRCGTDSKFLRPAGKLVS